MSQKFPLWAILVIAAVTLVGCVLPTILVAIAAAISLWATANEL